MQLDKTLIAIRERGLLETLDLSLQVVRHHCAALVLTFALGAVPMMLINQALLGWLLDAEFREGWLYEDEAAVIVRYLWDMSLLIALEAPLASLFTTSYLGKIVFVERPTVAEVFRDVLSLLPRALWCQLILRGILVAWLLLLTLERYGEFQPVVEFLLLGGVTACSVGWRAFRPFINEIVLLERNPVRASAQQVLTIGRRSAQLHGPSSADLLARWMGSALFATLLTAAVVGTCVFLSGVFLNRWQPEVFTFMYVIPLSMWVVAGFLTVVRFFSYLDLRIRQEGWEVELRLRAEAARLSGHRS
jgi:hypothetical protein